MNGLREALLSHLAAAPELRHAFGGAPRVHLEIPDQPAHPFLQIGRFQLDADVDRAGNLTVTSVSRFGGKAEAEALVKAIRCALFGVEIALADGRRAALRVTFSDVFRAADWRLTYGVVRVRAAAAATSVPLAA